MFGGEQMEAVRRLSLGLASQGAAQEGPYHGLAALMFGGRVAAASTPGRRHNCDSRYKGC